MRVWRITRARHAAEAFSGEGARRFAGRWNPAGIPLVYTSASLALATMETLVHTDTRAVPDDLVFLTAELPLNATALERAREWLLSRIPGDVREVRPERTQEIGAEWFASGRSLALPVPSVVIEGEWNIMLNPQHKDVSRIVVSDPVPFHLDARLFH